MTDKAGTSRKAAESDSGTGRILRKRKINLNRLSSAIVCPQVCQFQYCGIQLSDGDTLEVRHFSIFSLFPSNHSIIFSEKFRFPLVEIFLVKSQNTTL